MLKRSYRLRKDRDFQKLYRNGRRYTTPHFVVYYLASRFENTQVGFVVSKKVAKNAVVRNKLRRRASAVIEGYYPKISKPMHIIVLIRKDFSVLSSTELNTEINQLLGGIKL